MSKDKTVYVSGGGISLSTLLTVIFVVLKLVGTITWSWWWVLSPLWISAGLVIAFVIIALIVVGIVGLIVLLDENKK